MAYRPGKQLNCASCTLFTAHWRAGDNTVGDDMKLVVGSKTKQINLTIQLRSILGFSALALPYRVIGA